MRTTDNKQNEWAEYMVCYTVKNAKKKNKAKKMCLMVSGVGAAILYGVVTENSIIWAVSWKTGKDPAMLTSRGRALHAEGKWKQEHMVWGRNSVGEE